MRVTVPAVTLDTWAHVDVELQSLDERPHRVNLRVQTPPGLRAETPATGVEVPGRGRVSTRLGLLRAVAPRPSRQEIVLVATAADEPFDRTASARGMVEVRPDPARLPGLRPALLALGGLLLGGALLLERRRRGRRRG